MLTDDGEQGAKMCKSLDKELTFLFTNSINRKASGSGIWDYQVWAFALETDPASEKICPNAQNILLNYNSARNSQTIQKHAFRDRLTPRDKSTLDPGTVPITVLLLFLPPVMTITVTLYLS
jgi:hypothetical protein